MSLLGSARRELLRLRLSAQEALQPQPSRGQVEQVVREMTQGQQGQGIARKPQSTRYYGEGDAEERRYYEDREREHREQQSQQGQSPLQGQQPGLIGGLLGGLGGGRFPIRDALATYIKSRAGPQPQEGEASRGEKKKLISIVD